MHQERLRSLLQRHNRLTLPSQLLSTRKIRGNVFGRDLADKTGERKTPDEKIGRELIFLDLAEGDGSGLPAVLARDGGGIACC